MFEFRAISSKTVPPNGYRETAQGCRSCKEARRKRARPEPPQYIVADMERARDRMEAQRQLANDHANNPNKARAGLERAQLALHIIESRLRARGVLERCFPRLRPG